MKTLALVLVMMCLGQSAFAEIDDSRAIRAILGESGPSYAERLAIAHAIRNRGTLNGVYGCLKSPTAFQWQKGAMAWAEAENGPDTTMGAKNWLSDYDLKHARKALTAFRLKMIETAYIGHSHFYKEK